MFMTQSETLLNDGQYAKEESAGCVYSLMILHVFLASSRSFRQTRLVPHHLSCLPHSKFARLFEC